MGPHSLAVKIGKSTSHGRELLQAHKTTYPTYWQWVQAAIDQAMLHGKLWTVFGWPIHVSGEVNPRSLANHPCQANGAEMLRIAACLATERGISVCAPIHDALLVEGPADSIDDVVAQTQEAMAEAGRIVLDGFELRTDAEIVTYPNRYMDPRGIVLWQEVLSIVEGNPGKRACALPTHPVKTSHPVPSY
jgi:DNA polymerase-1